jgi:PAS domain S-box-containing protein
MDAAFAKHLSLGRPDTLPRMVALYCAILLALLWTGLGYQLSYERDDAIARHQAENANLARLFEEHVSRTLAAASITLRQLDDEYRLHGEKFDLEAYFYARREELAPYGGLSIVDRNGIMVLTTTPGSKGTNYRNLENFRFHMKNPTLDIFIAKPRLGVVTQRTTVYLSRRMNAPDGSFAGTISLSIDAGYFASFYDQIDLGSQSLVALVGTDGFVRARKSDASGDEGLQLHNMINTPLFTEQLAHADHGSFIGVSPVDKVERVLSYRAVTGEPLVVVVGTSMAFTLQGYEKRKLLMFWTGGGVSLMIVLFAVIFVYQLLRRTSTLEALRISEERYALVEGATEDGIWDKDLATGKSYFSARGHEILGYSPVALEDNPRAYFDLIHPDDRDIVTQTQARMVLDGRRHEVEFRMRHKNGGIRWVMVRARVVRDVDGRPMRLLGSVTDVTARKNAEMHIQKQSRLLDLIFTHSQDNIALLDRNFRYVRVSESYARGGGRDVAWFPGQDMFRQHLPRFRTELEQIFREKKVYIRQARPFSFPERPELGMTYWDISVAPILDRSGEIEYFLLASRDVTERVRAERRVVASVDRIRALSHRVVSVQEEERRRIARELHDEVGQGLTAVKIRMQAMMLTLGSQSDPQSRDNLAQALGAVAHTLEQVRSLSLDLRPMQLDDLGLPAALSSLINRDAEAAGWNVHFRESIGNERMHGDVELACYRVAQEALTNIMRHARATEVRVSLRRAADRLLLQVRDNGRGFDTAAARASAEHGHLGLLGMEERVGNVGGKLDISSWPGKGTTITASFEIEMVQETREARA